MVIQRTGPSGNLATPVATFGLAILLSFLIGPSHKVAARPAADTTMPCGVCSISPLRHNETQIPPFIPLNQWFFAPVRAAWTVRFLVDNTFQTPGGYTQHIAFRRPLAVFQTGYGVTHDLSGITMLSGGDAVRIFQRNQTNMGQVPGGPLPAKAFHLHALTTRINGILQSDAILIELDGPNLGDAQAADFMIREMVDTTTTIGSCEPFTGTATVFGAFRMERFGAGNAVGIRGFGAAFRLNCEIITSD